MISFLHSPHPIYHQVLFYLYWLLIRCLLAPHSPFYTLLYTDGFSRFPCQLLISANRRRHQQETRRLGERKQQPLFSVAVEVGTRSTHQLCLHVAPPCHSRTLQHVFRLSFSFSTCSAFHPLSFSFLQHPVFSLLFLQPFQYFCN